MKAPRVVIDTGPCACGWPQVQEQITSTGRTPQAFPIVADAWHVPEQPPRVGVGEEGVE